MTVDGHGLPRWLRRSGTRLPVQETWVRNLEWEDPLEKGMAAHSSILAWTIPRAEEPGGLQSMGSQRVRYTEQLTLPLSYLPNTRSHDAFGLLAGL